MLAVYICTCMYSIICFLHTKSTLTSIKFSILFAVQIGQMLKINSELCILKESGWVQSVRLPGGDLITETQQNSFDESFRSIHVHPNELEQLPLLIWKHSPDYLTSLHFTLQTSSGSSLQCTMTLGETLQPCHIVHSLTVSLQGQQQRRLYRDLMKDYNPLERPVFNDTHSLTVYFSFSLMQIMDVVSKLIQ